MKAFKLPKWTIGMPDRTLIDTKEMRIIFGYSPNTSVSLMIEKGYIPKPDKRLKSSHGYRNVYFQ